MSREREDLELLRQWDRFALPLAEAAGWIELSVLGPRLQFDPLVSVARCLQEHQENGRGQRVGRIWRLLAADEDADLDRLLQLERVRAGLGALLGPDGGPVAVVPFLDLLSAVNDFDQSCPATACERMWLGSIAKNAIRQIREVTDPDPSETKWRTQGRCIGCGARLLRWVEGSGERARATERGTKRLERTGRLFVARERAAYCCNPCKRARQQARHRKSSETSGSDGEDSRGNSET